MDDTSREDALREHDRSRAYQETTDEAVIDRICRAMCASFGFGALVAGVPALQRPTQCLLNAGRRMSHRPAAHPELWGDSGSYE